MSILILQFLNPSPKLLLFPQGGALPLRISANGFESVPSWSHGTQDRILSASSLVDVLSHLSRKFIIDMWRFSEGEHTPPVCYATPTQQAEALIQTAHHVRCLSCENLSPQPAEVAASMPVIFAEHIYPNARYLAEHNGRTRDPRFRLFLLILGLLNAERHKQQR